MYKHVEIWTIWAHLEEAKQPVHWKSHMTKVNKKDLIIRFASAYKSSERIHNAFHNMTKKGFSPAIFRLLEEP